MLPIRFLMAGVVGLCLNLSLSAPSFAAEPTSCEKLKLTPDKCRDPEVSKWGNWQSFILDQAGARYPNEAGALGEALTTISQQFPCGLNHHIVEVDFVTLDQTWSWVTREGATRIRFVAIPSAPSGACLPDSESVLGSISVQRSRTVVCLKGFEWQVNDDLSAVCVRH